MTERLLKLILNTHIPFCLMNTDKFNTADMISFKHPDNNSGVSRNMLINVRLALSSLPYPSCPNWLAELYEQDKVTIRS